MSEPTPNGWRTFLTLWGTQSLSVVGSALSYFAITIYLTQTLYPNPDQKASLAFALSAVALAGALPAIFGSPIAGAWADRHDRRRVMLTCDFGSALVSALLAVLVVFGALPLWALVPLVALGSLLGTFHGSAFDTSYAVLVPHDKLPRANGMMQTLWTLSGLLAPGLAAFLIAAPALLGQRGVALPLLHDGTALVFLLDAVSFVFAGLVLTRLHIPTPPRSDERPKSLWSDVGFGFKYIFARRPLLWLLGTFSVVNFIGGPLGVFEPLIVKFTLGPDWTARGLTFEAALAILTTIGGLGGVLGGVLISTWGGLKERRVFGVLVPMILAGFALIAFALSTNLYLSAFLAAINFGMTPILNAHSQAIWQTQVPPEMQGRVFSVRRLIAQCTGPFSTFLAGIAGGVFSPSSVLLVLGIVQVVFCIAQLFNPYLRRVEDKAWLERIAAKRSTPAAD
ncbi:MFS transporter [Deinococcus yavapaiensis]|uniref:MFS-type transporter involved in bile tolerance (Atg22 family) n=1 Tax=Deinococcus yavapaiensis KR-236 TaxID=694435 RepID=A0A318S599_9DEIO|nr:MFS transporter [Deinococcus yavapaiensis]PYE48968.1 MFS-type transporter involved in bile tolerance (Atg22 family) [Deinococcus yavapaiensis KR-236]